MKNLFKRAVVLAMCALMIVFTVSCTDNKDTSEKDSGKQQNQTEEKPAENEIPKAALPSHLVFGEDKESIEIKEQSYTTPTEQDVIEAYKKASEAVLWFNGYSVPALDKDKIYSEDGIHYAKVKSQTVKDLESMKAYLETVFDFDMADLLVEDSMETKRFIEREDGLYCVAFNRYRGVTDEAVEVSKVSDSEYSVSVSYKVVNPRGDFVDEGKCEYSFVKENGKWGFGISFTLHYI